MLAISDGELGAALGSLIRHPYTRQRLRSEWLIERQFSALGEVADSVSRLAFGYSVKTNPASAYLRAARDHGFFAETISNEELLAAARVGFRTILYNGPHPAWQCTRPPSIAFADSFEALEENARRLSGTIAGIRIRPHGIASRFGVASDDPNLTERVRNTARNRTAVSFHVRPEDYGQHSWREIASIVLDAAERIEARGVRVVAFDIGGGWTPEAFDSAIERGDFQWIAHEVSRALPHCEYLIGEPGQAVVTPCEAIVAPILERREDAIVIDGGYPDFPQMSSSRHRIFFAGRDGRFELLRDGDTSIGGNTCLEYDRFQRKVALPPDAGLGDAIVIADCGGYDSSMSFSFAKAGEKDVA